MLKLQIEELEYQKMVCESIIVVQTPGRRLFPFTLQAQSHQAEVHGLRWALVSPSARESVADGWPQYHLSLYMFINMIYPFIGRFVEDLSHHTVLLMFLQEALNARGLLILLNHTTDKSQIFQKIRQNFQHRQKLVKDPGLMLSQLR